MAVIKGLDKVQYPFMISPQHMRNRAELPHLHKKHLQETHNVIVNDVKLETRQGWELLPHLLSIILGLLASAKGRGERPRV